MTGSGCSALLSMPQPARPSQESRHFQIPMAEEGAVFKMTSDLKGLMSTILPTAVISAILQGYGRGRQPFDQKEQKSFLRPRKDYWDFLCTALWRQRGDTEPVHFVHSQDKLKTPLGKGRAFIRFCLAHGQLAESLQLCLLNPELTREWYGPRSPLVCPELQEDILDSLYALNEVTFDLDLQRPDLDGAWPMFSESRCSNSNWTQGRRPRKIKDSPKEISPTYGDPTGGHPEEPHTRQASSLQDAPREDRLAGLPRAQQHKHQPLFLEKKKEDPRRLGPPQSMWELEGEELQQNQEKGAPRMGICLENSTPSIQGQGKGAKGTLKEVIGTEAEGRGVLLSAEGQRTRDGTYEGEAERSHIHRLLASSPKEMLGDAVSGSRQGGKVPSIPREFWVLQGLETKEGSTTEKPQEQIGVTTAAKREEQAEMALQDVVKEERARLQAELEQKQREAERKGAVYEEELGGQRDLVRAMKRRVLELIQLCGGLVCHACSVDFKKKECHCPPCSQRREAQVL
ncbi:hypothetical protein E2I00_007036 [Balaenoptera physalus]|uniref:RUN and FYVE domain-containing protein 4 n=1 Tax=Balaenoptera physalus TaxID=9770 RepID=A0A6A1QJK5_BALPH|nr:hypothetical protein E2I00_007036 [Balaenoptera physalus]